MTVEKVGIILLFCFIVDSESLSLSQFPKCDMNDNICLQNLIQSVLRKIGNTGVEDLGIPPIDPLQLNNVSVSLLGLLDISLEDGVVKGVKDCIVNNVSSDSLKERFSLDLICDITIKGHYKAYSSSPLIKSLLGGDFIHGDGIGKVKIEKLNLKINFKPIVSKHEDGEVYLFTNINETKCDFELIGNIRFSANNIFLGDQDVSTLVTEMLNQNAKSLAPFFGRPFLDKSLEYVDSLANKFFNVVPARFYIKDDLSPYVV